jgi:drug/metabolite transporter (DMT)-like permease
MTAMLRLQGKLSASPILLLSLAMLLWACNTVAGRLAVDQISPLLLVTLRWAGVLAVLWPMYGREVKAHWPAVRARWPWLLGMGFFGFTAFNVLFYYAAHSTSAVNIGILQGSMPIFVMVGAALLYAVRPGRLQIIGASITTLGVVLVATQGSPSTLLQMAFNRGDLLLLLACVLYSGYSVGLRQRPAMPGVVFFTMLALVASVTSLPLLAIDAALGSLHVPTLQGLLVTLFIAIFPSCLAQLLFMRGVDLIGPARAGVFLNLVPIFSAFLGVGLLGEPFRWYHGIAIVLVIGGIWVAENAPRSTGDQKPAG